MKVTLLNHTLEPERMIATAARICYDKTGSFEEINNSFTDEKIEKFEKYYQLLIEYNQKFNITAITDKKEVYVKNLY